MSICCDKDLVVKISGRLNVSDDKSLYTAELDRLMIGTEVLTVAKHVASGGPELHTPATILRF